MSKITTNSLFYYGTTVTAENRSLDFDEGGPEIQATLNVGSYTPTDFAAEVQRAMRAAGSQLYTVTLNRSTRKLTFVAPLGGANLRSNTGTRVGTGVWTTAGVSTASDHSMNTDHVATNGAGLAYKTQWPVSDYLSFDDNLVKEQGTVSTTPSGISQVIHFGDGSRAEMNIRLITNENLFQACNGESFVYNANGIDDAKSLMSYLVSKGRVEFMPDADAPNSFVKCFLESTPDDRQGLRYRLRNMNTPDVYETGVITLRKVLA